MFTPLTSHNPQPNMTSPITISRTLFVSAFLILFSFHAIAQDGGVGIGTTNPQATLHVKGASFPGGSGIRTLLDENFDSYTMEKFGSSVGNCYSDGWELQYNPPNASRCADCTGMMLFTNSNSPDPRNCEQDETAIVRFASTPTTTTVNISFDAKLQIYTAADRLFIYLYNENTSEQVLLDTFSGPDQTAIDRSYSATQTVVPGDSYSIRFHYEAEDGWGATADNVLVTEEATAAPASYVLRLEDGSQGAGKVLTAADANGNAYWATPSSLRPAITGSGTISETTSRGNGETQELVIRNLQAIINDHRIRKGLITTVGVGQAELKCWGDLSMNTL